MSRQHTVVGLTMKRLGLLVLIAAFMGCEPQSDRMPSAPAKPDSASPPPPSTVADSARPTSLSQIQVYELQERCGKQTEAFFKSEYGTGISSTKEGQSGTNYENHYNTRLNKCFFLESTTALDYTSKNRSGSVLIRLFDFNEKKQYGSYFKRFEDNAPSDCNVAGKICQSASEWELLIKPFMED